MPSMPLLFRGRFRDLKRVGNYCSGSLEQGYGDGYRIFTFEMTSNARYLKWDDYSSKSLS